MCQASPTLKKWIKKSANLRAEKAFLVHPHQNTNWPIPSSIASNFCHRYPSHPALSWETEEENFCLHGTHLRAAKLNAVRKSEYCD